MSGRRAASCALATLLLIMGCATKAAPGPSAAPVAVAAGPDSAAERASCPRVERAPRLWTGFLVEVPSEAMVRALDAVVPIQIALGELFCAPERADCRPSELLAIDLTDEHANVAQLRLLLAPADGHSPLSLTLRAQDQTWRAEAESLAQYLALCRDSKRAPPREPTTTKAAPE